MDLTSEEFFVAAGAALAVLLSINPAAAGKNSGGENKLSNSALDFNEQTHLEFMCEEEKLARDVYITLGAKFLDSTTFGQIDDSEERHKCAVTDMLKKYGIPSPST